MTTGRSAKTLTPSPTVTSPMLWMIAAPRSVRAEPIRCTMAPESGRLSTEPSEAASRVNPSSPADRPRACLRSGTREAKDAKAAPLIAKAVNTAIIAVRTTGVGTSLLATRMRQSSLAQVRRRPGGRTHGRTSRGDNRGSRGYQRDTPRTWKSSPTLAAFLPWGSSERYHHAGCRWSVYAAPARFLKCGGIGPGGPLFVHQGSALDPAGFHPAARLR